MRRAILTLLVATSVFAQTKIRHQVRVNEVREYSVRGRISRMETWADGEKTGEVLPGTELWKDLLKDREMYLDNTGERLAGELVKKIKDLTKVTFTNGKREVVIDLSKMDAREVYKLVEEQIRTGYWIKSSDLTSQTGDVGSIGDRRGFSEEPQ